MIAGFAIAILIAGLVRTLTGEQPMEAVAGVSVMEAATPSTTVTVTQSPTARVLTFDRDDATKTPKDTSDSDSDD